MNKRKAQGFTLLEFLVALAIGAIILGATYVIVIQVARIDEQLSEREEQLTELVYLKRILEHDAQFCWLDSRSLQAESGALYFSCRGDLIPNMDLGPKLYVYYKWQNKEDNEGRMEWHRYLLPATEEDPTLIDLESEVVADWHMIIDGGITAIEQQWWFNDSWVEKGQIIQGQQALTKNTQKSKKTKYQAAVRWQFSWSELGQWSFALPLNTQKAEPKAGENNEK